MGAFNTKKTIQASPSLIPLMGERIKETLVHEGYEVEATPLISGGYDISIRKGNVFKAILGLKTALKVSLQESGNGILLDASVGIWGQQIIPFAIAWFVTWPVLLTQIWGLVQQSKLDDKVIAIAESVAMENPRQETYGFGQSFCSECGYRLSPNHAFCPQCGTKI